MGPARHSSCSAQLHPKVKKGTTVGCHGGSNWGLWTQADYCPLSPGCVGDAAGGPGVQEPAY